MAEDKNAMSDEELELERQQELEQEGSDVDTSDEDEESEETEEQGEEESGTPADEDSEEEPENNDETDGSEEDEPRRQTRKERRAERAKRFSEIRKDTHQINQQRRQNMRSDRYNPMDYSKADEELTVDQLNQDRQNYGQSEFSRGAELSRFVADQERYNDRIETDNDYVLARPEYAFLDEDNADAFDSQLADDINEAHLAFAQYDDTNKVWGNTNVRYKDTVAMMVRFGEKYHQMKSTASKDNIRQQKTQAGVRPTAGKSNGSSRTFTPQQIADMSPSQYQKYKADIDRQMQNMFS